EQELRTHVHRQDYAQVMAMEMTRMSGDQTVTIEMLKEMTEAFNRHDLHAIMGFFAEDCSMDLPRGSAPWGTRYVGKAKVREAIAGRFEGIPDVQYGNGRHWVSGNMGVSEWTLTGTTTSGVHVEV